MSLDKDVAKFISDIPIVKAPIKTYTIEEAKTIYRENYRDRIYDELKLKHIQKKIRNKILNRKCGADEDILFKKVSIEQEMINTNISGLLSECEEEEIIQETVETNKKTHKTKKVLKYLDLEAEQSGEESEAYEDDGSDLSSIVDDQQEDENTAASVYADQKQKHDLEVLKKLVGKFKQRRKSDVKEIEQVEIDDSSSEGEVFSEMPYEEMEIPKEQVQLEYVKEEGGIKNSSIVFNKKRKVP